MKNDITGITMDLYKEVTPKGKILLTRLIDLILFELECIRKTVDMEEK